VPPQPDPDSQARRFRQFVAWDIPANLLGAAFVLVLGWLFGLPFFGWLGLGLLANSALLVWAYRRAARGRLDRPVTVVCAGLWLIALTLGFGLPVILPLVVLLAVWPVALALPYVTGSTLARLMVVSTLVSLAAGLFALRPDPLGVEAVLPGWLVRGVLVVVIPVYTGFIFLLLWHHSGRLGESLDQMRAANAALRASEELLDARVAQRTEELAAARDQALDATRAKSAFLANMSHELRTPLNAILGYTELILDGIYGEPPDRIRDVLGRVDRSGRHLLSLINDVLDLSRIEAGRLELTMTEYALSEVVRSACAAMEPLAAEKGLGLMTTLPEDLPIATGDERRITQVLLNLIGNAIKFTDAGTVRVQAMLVDHELQVSVADTGPGIAAADQERIFEVFQQADSSSTKQQPGAGLGLAISRRIVELHGGRLWVESRPGQGATFIFSLPVRVGAPVAVA
jgi:signal transduction histidine kinase